MSHPLLRSDRREGRRGGMHLYVSLGSSSDIGRKRPYNNRRFRRCGYGPEHVSFPHTSPCHNRGERVEAPLTDSAPCDPSAARRSPRRLLVARAEVLWRGGRHHEKTKTRSVFLTHPSQGMLYVPNPARHGERPHSRTDSSAYTV